MTAVWEAKAVGDLCSIVGGGTPSRSNAAFYGGEIPWATIRDMKADWIESTEFSITPAAVKSSATNVLPAGTVIVASRVGLGKVCRLRRETAINQDLRGFIPKSEKQLDPQYLFLWFKSVADQIVAAGTGATVQGVTLPFLRSLQIPLPPLEEQRRIVAVLDEALAAIATVTANAEENLADTRLLLNRALLSTFEGDDFRIGDQLELQRGFDITKKDQRSGAVPVVSSSGVKSRHSTSMAKGPGVVIGRKGTLGSAFYVNEPYWPHDTTLWVKDFKGNDPKLVYYLFRCLDVKKLDSGTANPSLNRNLVHALKVGWPQITDQSAIVANLEKLEDEMGLLQRKYEQKIELLAILKQSLLHRAFSGELTSKAAADVAPNDNFATPEFAAKIIAFAYERHVAKNRVRNFGTVKAEKILHMVEAIGGIDLGRQPLRDAAGPDDAKHRHATWDWARSQHFFRFNKRSSGGHDFEKLSSYSRMIEDARTAIAGTAIEKAIELLVDMDRDFAELIATTYAAWNNLIIDQCAAADDDIVLAARDNWHRDKLRFDPSRFHDAIRFIRNNSIVPNGTAKRVGGQEALLF